MPKPIGYYTNHTPGDGGVIDTLERAYGSYLQELSALEKSVILSNLADEVKNHAQLLAETGAINQCCRPQVLDKVSSLVGQLGLDDIFGTMQAIIEQLKENN
jgi:hypothetical protein